MFTKQALVALVAAGLVANSDAGALASLPNGRTLTYDVRETPGDVESPLIYEYEMHLTAQQQNGNSIGWDVDSVTIRELDANGQVINTWVDSTPNVDSADGLWWAVHADPTNPVLGEFAESPSIDGTAGADMDYEFEGLGASTAMAAVDLILWPVGNPAPEVKYESEPLVFHSHPDPD